MKHLKRFSHIIIITLKCNVLSTIFILFLTSAISNKCKSIINWSRKIHWRFSFSILLLTGYSKFEYSFFIISSMIDDDKIFIRYKLWEKNFNEWMNRKENKGDQSSITKKISFSFQDDTTSRDRLSFHVTKLLVLVCFK